MYKEKTYYNVSIPKGWNMKELKFLSDKIMVGIATEVKPNIRDKGVPIIRNQNIRENYFDDNEIIYISEEFDLANRNKRVKLGDVLIVRTGSNTGQACLVPDFFNNAQTFTTLIVRTNKGLLSPEYFLFHINSFGVREVERLAVGGGKPNLNAGFLNSYRILTPPLKEQKLINNCLSNWIESTSLMKLLIDQKQLQKKWLMQQLLTGKKRLPGFDGAWKEKKIGNILKEYTEKSKKTNTHKRISVKLNLKGICQRQNKREIESSSTVYYRRNKGQFVYGKQNLHKGAMGIIPLELDGFESTQDIPSFDINEEFSPEWFLYFMSRSDFYKRLENISTGTGSKRIQPRNLFKIKIIVPEIQEQKAIAKVLTKADKEIKLLEQKLIELKEQKKGLMQQLLTGKKRLV